MRFAQWGGSCLGQIVTDSAAHVRIGGHRHLAVAYGGIAGHHGIASVAQIACRRRRGRGRCPALRVKRVAVQCGLSPREQEVLAIWATGHTGAYIEKQLFISKNTVKTHLNQIYAKNEDR